MPVINEVWNNNGTIRCPDHIGAEAQEVLREHPNVVRIGTTQGIWVAQVHGQCAVCGEEA